MNKRTKIIATVGPVSSTAETLKSLAEAGVDVFRINFSHGDEESRDQFFQTIRQVESELGKPLAICGDLCGPKIRVGVINGGKVQLQEGDEIIIQRETIDGSADRISTTLPELIDVADRGQTILLSDGRLRFEVLESSPPEQIRCRVMVGGELSSGKGINLPETQMPVSALTEKDRRDIQWIGQREFDYVALSFVQNAENVLELRGLLDQSGSQAKIISKIEKPQALKDIDAIIEASFGLMVARGDLGVEMELPTVPIVQKMLAKKCQAAGIPCIIATEMMESMIRSAIPTRAEVSDVANAVFDHTDAVMLSAESAIGDYPVKTVTQMSRAVAAAEGFLDEYGGSDKVIYSEPKTAASVAASINRITELQPLAAVVVLSRSGTSARLIAKNRPDCPIIAISDDQTTLRRCCLFYGVIPYRVSRPAGTTELLEASVEICKSLELAKSGDHIAVVSGYPLRMPGAANGIILQQVM